jgi:DNA-binding NarL/FixJ family response regulator
VLVSAASAVSRAGLETIVAREPSFIVVGFAGGATLAEELAECDPDVVLVELTGSVDEDVLPTLRTLAADTDDGARSAALVVLTDERDPADGIEALRAGARALLPRDASVAEITAAIVAAAAGLVVVASGWTSALHSALGVERGAREEAPALSAREREVLRLIAEGLGNKQIAARLAISEHTVKFHVGSVFGKIGATSRAEAVVIGARRGLIAL